MLEVAYVFLGLVALAAIGSGALYYVLDDVRSISYGSMHEFDYEDQDNE